MQIAFRGAAQNATNGKPHTAQTPRGGNTFGRDGKTEFLNAQGVLIVRAGWISRTPVAQAQRKFDYENTKRYNRAVA